MRSGEANPDDITWGAFQAYGDPGWRIDPRADEGAGQDDGLYVSPDELLDELARRPRRAGAPQRTG